MREAVDKVNEGRSIRSVATEYNIAFKTLARYVEKQKTVAPNDEFTVSYSSHRQIFTNKNESDFKEYVKLRAKMCYGLTRNDVKKAAYDFAKHLNIPYPSTWDRDHRAGEEWLKHFRSRHEDLKLKKPEACSLSRATSFNRSNVELFFNNLQTILQKVPELASGLCMYNLDKTGLSTVQTPQKVLADANTCRLNKVTSAERGVTVTACCIISSAGNYLPPAMVFPRHHFKDHMLKGAPNGTLGLANPSGWMVTELFVDVMRHFIKHSNSTPDNPSLLIMDNHDSHLGPAANRMAKENGVHTLTLPPHCSDKMQPLDKTVYRSTKGYYNAAMDKWMCNNPGKTITIYNVSELFADAFYRSMTPSNICAGFKSTGIFPFNPDVFDEELYLCSYVTDRPNPQENDPTEEDEDDPVAHAHKISNDVGVVSTVASNNLNATSQPSTTGILNNASNNV